MCLPPPRAHLFPYTTLFRSKTLTLSGSSLDARSKVTMDVDEWLRAFAVLSLAGVGDVYSSDNAHNLQVYKRPEDGRMLALPWDWDFGYVHGHNAPLWFGANISKVIAIPTNTRLYYGHMLDLTNTTWNADYMAYWV